MVESVQNQRVPEAFHQVLQHVCRQPLVDGWQPGQRCGYDSPAWYAAEISPWKTWDFHLRDWDLTWFYHVKLGIWDNEVFFDHETKWDWTIKNGDWTIKNGDWTIVGLPAEPGFSESPKWALIIQTWDFTIKPGGCREREHPGSLLKALSTRGSQL